ncbi:NAD-dependent epimerase/dehydratase family protein [Paracrocinitomix mangrovi]|uniref:NAD-dependent epimerase/dehydratase family protein n=1 Tax=Paracrocinitomix mangrovi TaxID=2862509 RepID=UPI001C8EE2D9|nr:NAD-dependent epimerase/dehydratase family protein [Paracrocinitomix mangrovi]UKN00910.1 NAD-dependent epimerase/dehydratase family protein [Paracrocinitomix mangrovi]
MKKILVIGSSGQIGTELVTALREKFGNDAVVASDIKEVSNDDSGPFEVLDVMDMEKLTAIVDKHGINEIYLLAALLSATAEKNPKFAWDLNMIGLFNVLNLAKEGKINKVFWPSSIAVFGPSTPKHNTPQFTIMEPTTVYGISKLAGERWCEYYAKNYNVDVRSIRYPGLISYASLPGGGTTDYAVDIFYSAKKGEKFSCFLKADTPLPMMYMEDAIRATIDLMEAPAEKVKVRSSYNIAGMSFTPEEIFNAVKRLRPDFEIEYQPDFRQKIADSWPGSIDDSKAAEDWGWKAKFDINDLAQIMFDNVSV